MNFNIKTTSFIKITLSRSQWWSYYRSFTVYTFRMFSYNVHMSICFRKDESQTCIYLWTPYAFFLCNSLSCGTVSNALLNSIMAMSVSTHLPCDFSRSCNVTRNCVSVEYPDLKPWLRLVSILYLSKCFNRWLHIMCSSNLHGTEVNETGL